MNTSARIIGIAGAFASGKDSLARYLETNYQMKHISTSDMVRVLAQDKYGSIERPILYKTANEFRESHGAGALSEMALEQYEYYKNEFPGGVCVTGFRAWAEAEVINKAGGIIVYTDAPAELRFKRTVERARDNEKVISFEEFLERENAENGGVDSKFNIAGIKPHADIVLDNSKVMDEFLADAVAALGFANS